ncbi:MAG: hypothetical protein ACR2ND_08720 [Solirubrobacteraceae bacterium]
MLQQPENPSAAALRAIAVLSPAGGDVVEVARLRPADALPVLLYSTFFVGPSRNAVTFHKLASLVAHAPVFRVRLPQGLPALVERSSELVASILNAI